jgi:hypothetical protein
MKINEDLQKNQLHLALIRWYDFKLEKTPYKYGCAYMKLTDIYNIVEIEAIYDIVHVIPRFGKKNEYLINKFIF